MKKQLLFLCAFTSVAILLVSLAVMKHYVSLEAAGSVLLGVFSLISALTVWRSSKRERSLASQGPRKTGNGLVGLLLIFIASAVVALLQALHDGWDIGDTIGSIFFAVFAGLSIYEILRRKRRNDSK